MRLGSSGFGFSAGIHESVTQMDEMTSIEVGGEEKKISTKHLLLDVGGFGYFHMVTSTTQTSIMNMMKRTGSRSKQALLISSVGSNFTEAMKICKDAPPLIGSQDAFFKYLLNVSI